MWINETSTGCVNKREIYRLCELTRHLPVVWNLAHPWHGQDLQPDAYGRCGSHMHSPEAVCVPMQVCGYDSILGPGSSTLLNCGKWNNGQRFRTYQMTLTSRFWPKKVHSLKLLYPINWQSRAVRRPTSRLLHVGNQWTVRVRFEWESFMYIRWPSLSIACTFAKPVQIIRINR